MAENTGNNNSTAADTVSAVVKGAGASKAGKALLGKAAGPYGTLAVSAWENRKTVFAILCALLFLLMLPVLFILMLPSLIFGNGGLDDVPENVLNDNEVIMENIAEAETSIEAILREKHDAVLGRIQAEADALGSDCEYSITDEFADQIIYESALIISQFCASQEDFREVKLAALEGILRRNTDGIFSYTTEVTSREEEDEETGETHTIYHYEYTVSYAGDAYFSGNVFFLSEEQAETAAQYASNLHLFLFDTVYHVEINPDLVPGETGNAAVDLALTKLGTPYSQANRDKEGYFDCSSFTWWVYYQLGVNLSFDGSNTAAAQGRYIAENNLAVAYESLAPGDLIFYSFGVNKRYLNIGHVAIYAGDGYVVDASSSKKKVNRKAPLFQPGTGQGAPYHMALPAFYHSREVKELGAEAIKINNSRTIGILLAPEYIYAVFCTGGALMKWEYRTELKVKALLSYHASQGILSGSRGGPRYHPDTPVRALIIGEGMDTALKLMESTGGFRKSYFYLDSSFDFFHYVPDDSTGEAMIRLLCSPALQKALNGLLLSDLQPPCSDYGLEHDALRDGYPVLLSYDFDMLRLSRFRTALSLRGMTGHLICFDFQKTVLGQYFRETASIETIDLKKFERRFLH